MFNAGFKKVAYSLKDHMVDMEETDLKHQAKKNPWKHGLGMAAGGTAVGAGVGRALAPKFMLSVKGIGKKKSDLIRKNVDKLNKSMKSSGTVSGAKKGLLLGSVLGALAARRINKGKKLEAMSPEERKAYLAGSMGH